MKSQHYILTKKELNELLKNAWDNGSKYRPSILNSFCSTYIQQEDCFLLMNRHEASDIIYKLAYGCKFGQKLLDIEAACIMSIMRTKAQKRSVKTTSIIIKIMNYMKDALAEARVILYKEE